MNTTAEQPSSILYDTDSTTGRSDTTFSTWGDHHGLPATIASTSAPIGSNAVPLQHSPGNLGQFLLLIGIFVVIFIVAANNGDSD